MLKLEILDSQGCLIKVLLQISKVFNVRFQSDLLSNLKDNQQEDRTIPGLSEFFCITCVLLNIHLASLLFKKEKKLKMLLWE